MIQAFPTGNYHNKKKIRFFNNIFETEIKKTEFLQSKTKNPRSELAKCMNTLSL